MKITDVRRSLTLAASSMLLLCSCATKPHVDAQAQPDAKPASAQDGAKPIANGGFQSQQVMTPQDNIEKDKLLISYSIKAIPTSTDYLIKVSMVFRNLKDRSVNLKPVIALSDGSGNRIEAYSKKGFLIHMSVLAADKSAKDGAGERTKWANAYWLKSRFTIPPNGIEVGELVFHSARIDNLPMKLTVNSAKQDFTFTITQAIPVVTDQK